MDDTIRIDAQPLTRHETVAVRHLLTHSALADCEGRHGRLVLHTNLDGESALTVGDLHTWSWSSGEVVLLEVLMHLVGAGSMPSDPARLDDRNRRVATEALMLAIPQAERAGAARLLAAVDASPETVQP